MISCVNIGVSMNIIVLIYANGVQCQMVVMVILFFRIMFWYLIKIFQYWFRGKSLSPLPIFMAGDLCATKIPRLPSHRVIGE